MTQLRAEADAANDRAEAAEAKNKKQDQQILQLEQENSSLQHRLALLEGELNQSEAKLQDTKKSALAGEQSIASLDSSQRKVQLLEEELDTAEKNLKETMEKQVILLLPLDHLLIPGEQTKAGRCKGGAFREAGPTRRAGARPMGTEIRGLHPAFFVDHFVLTTFCRNCKRNTSNRRKNSQI